MGLPPVREPTALLLQHSRAASALHSQGHQSFQRKSSWALLLAAGSGQRSGWSSFERGTRCQCRALLGLQLTTFRVLGKMINRCVFPFPNISLLNCKVASCLFWSTICPTFQAQLIANFLCRYESMIYLTNFHPANKTTFVLPGG